LIGDSGMTVIRKPFPRRPLFWRWTMMAATGWSGKVIGTEHLCFCDTAAAP
jgi:hypothetical protein